MDILERDRGLPYLDLRQQEAERLQQFYDEVERQLEELGDDWQIGNEFVSFCLFQLGMKYYLQDIATKSEHENSPTE